VDATGMGSRHTSRYFFKRAGRRHNSRLWTKLAVACETKSHFLTGATVSLGPANAALATGAHISIAGHITKPELVKYMRDTEALNGFANRFIWLCVRRSRLLPDGGRALDLSPFGKRLNKALAAARNVGAMARNEAAGRLWREVYPS
jgi:hypothetical protein